MDWLQWLTASGAMGALGIALATYFKTRPEMKAAQVKGEAALWSEIAAMRSELKLERGACDERIERIEARHKADMKELKKELQVLRHDRNNVRQGLNAMFAMIKRTDDVQLKGIALAVEEMVARGDEIIAVEKGAMRR